jgi:methylmalonyl-CoA mutase cobalamin-binding subunit
VTPTEAVAAAIQEQADAAGVPVSRAYQTNSSPQQLCALAEQALASDVGLHN